MCVRRIFAASHTALASCNISFFSHFAVSPPRTMCMSVILLNVCNLRFPAKEAWRAASLIFEKTAVPCRCLTLRFDGCVVFQSEACFAFSFSYAHRKRIAVYLLLTCFQILSIFSLLRHHRHFHCNRFPHILNRVAQITICWIKEKMVKFTISCLVNIVAELLCIASTFFAEAWAKQWCIYF